jgi:RNA polymerase sigma factor (TIGR02999 family)
MLTVSLVELTELLQRIHAGDRDALDAAIPLVYGELKKVAANHLRKESAQRVETTALVHETFVKMAGLQHPCYENRAHFFAIASRLMRQILVDHARASFTHKRVGVQIEVTELLNLTNTPRGPLLLDLDEALHRLAATDPRKVELIEMRYFGGMTAEESAVALGITAHMARRDLRLAHAWLHRELGQPQRREGEGLKSDP